MPNRPKQEIVKYSRLLYQRGLVGAAGGNVSIKFGERVYITAGGKSLRDIEVQDILEVDLEGNKINKKTGLKPSKETSLHLNIYLARKDMDCVIHVHPVYATAFAVKGQEIPMITASSRLKLVNVPIVGYADPGSKKLSEMVYRGVTEAQKKTCAVMLEAHGLIAFAEGIENCFNVVELAEETAKIAYLSGGL